MIQISRKEQQVLRNLNNAINAEQLRAKQAEESQDKEFQPKSFLDILKEVNPSLDTIQSLVDKGIVNPDEGTITKEQLQVQDDDPEVEQAWEDFRAVQGDGSMSKLYDRNRKAEAASKHLEEVLFKKGRLVHMVSGTDHIWVTEDKVEGWKKKGWKEGSQAAVPSGL